MRGPLTSSKFNKNSAEQPNSIEFAPLVESSVLISAIGVLFEKFQEEGLGWMDE
jgi:hypothetical protein